MIRLDVRTAQRLLLWIAGIYLLLVGAVELAALAHTADPETARELVQKLTTLASLSVGTVIGFYLASGLRES